MVRRLRGRGSRSSGSGYCEELLERPPPDGFLRIYLQDHHAASAAGLDLAWRIAHHAQNRKNEEELSDLARQTASSGKELTAILQKLSVKESRTKAVLARLGERLSRLKPNGAFASYSSLDQLIALKTLSTGIVGQRALWRSLEAVKESVPALEGTDLERLVAAADAQFDQVERSDRSRPDRVYAKLARARRQSFVVGFSTGRAWEHRSCNRSASVVAVEPPRRLASAAPSSAVRADDPLASRRVCS